MTTAGAGLAILVLTSEFQPFRGGIASYVAELCLAAAAAGHAVTLVAPDYGADQGAADAALPFTVVRYRGTGAFWPETGRRLRITRSLLRQGRFDIVHAANWPFFMPVRLFGRPARHRILLTLHGTEVLHLRSRGDRLVLGALGFWRRHWATWVANSRYTGDLAGRSLPLDPADIRVVPLGVSARVLAAPRPRAAARAALGVADRLVVLSLGRVVPRKGHLVLAEALGRLPADLQARLCWWIVGKIDEDDHGRRLREAVAALPVETQILGPLPDDAVAERLSAADLFCLPGYRDRGLVEGFGLVFLEAAAYSVSSIATRSGGIPDAIDDGVTGLLVAERDPAALAEAIATLAGDDDRRAAMAAAARVRAERSTWARVMEETYGG